MIIEGMKCMHCKASVEKALAAVPGVLKAEVDLEKKTAAILTDGNVSDNALMNAVSEKGFVPVKMI